MHRAGRLIGLCLLVMVTVASVAVPAAWAADRPPPAGEPAGSGSLQGTERVDEWDWSGEGICIENTKAIFALAGIGTYHGRTEGGDDVVYRAEIDETQGQTLYGDGPVKVEVETNGVYYHGPFGTHGTSDSTCSAATAGTPVPADFRIFATDHVYRLDGTTRVPCIGTGTFARGEQTTQKDNLWYAEWTLSQDCTVVGNAAGVPGSGVAPAGTATTHSGTHDPCSSGSCPDNFKVDFKQYLPFEGLYVGLSGPASAPIGTPVTVAAAVTNDGIAVPNAPVTFSVAGPVPAEPPGGAALTGADGRAGFTFTAASPGNYTVTASVTSGAETASNTKVVRFDPPAPAMRLDGPPRGQTEEGVTVTATFTNAGNPLPGSLVSFAVAGPGEATPASGTAVTGADGKASFSFAADRAGEYTVTASGSVAGENASATHGVDLEVRSFYLAGSIESQPAQQGAAVIAPAGDYAYFGGGSGVEKIDLRSFQQVGLLALEPGDSVLLSAVMDPAGRYAYFGTESGRVVKIDLATFQRVGAINLTQDDLSSAVIDPSGGYAYFGTANTSVVAPPSKVLKVDLATFSHVGTLALEPGEESLWSAVMDPAGHFAYFGAQGDADLPANVVKVDLATFSRVGAATLTGRDEGVLTAAVIDPKGTFAYFGTGTPVNPARVVKVDLVTLERVGALVLDPTEVKIQSAVMDPFGRYAYFTPQHSFGYAGAAGPGAKVVKVDLESFARHSAITMPTGDMGSLRSAVIDPAGNFAYFKKIDVLFPPPPTPAKVYKIAVSRPPVSWLAAGDDAYATPYATPLTIRAPGVLANDTDTGDGDPLTAALLRHPAHGTVSLAPDGSFTYTSDAGFSGVDTFTYRASDAMDLSAPATVTVTVAEPPVGVQSVSGGAHGYFTNVSLFGGPASTRGPAPAVTLPANGGNESATDPDGAEALYGPARIFENHGPLTVHTEGTTGSEGYAASSASVHDIEDNDPFHAHSPDGEASSTCRADESGLSGSTHIVNGRLVVHTNPNTGEPTEQITFPHAWDPAPNTTYEGALDHVGDQWRIVFNEQVLTPDAITVNAVHMYLLGPTAVGEMIIGQSRCGVQAAVPNAAPTATEDAYDATSGQALTVSPAGVLANDTDPDGQPLRASVLAAVPPANFATGQWSFPSDPAHGSLTLHVDGSFTYTPDDGYLGPDSFTYVVSDSRGKSDTATVAIDVQGGPTGDGAPVADFDGDGTSDVGVYRPAAGVWYLRNSTAGDTASAFGTDGDVATPADYDGDGKVDIAVYRPSSGVWYVEGGPTVAWGTDGDVPVPADYDGDGKTDVSVFRPSTGAWYLRQSTAGDTATVFGTDGDVALPLSAAVHQRFF